MIRMTPFFEFLEFFKETPTTRLYDLLRQETPRFLKETNQNLQQTL